MRLAWLGAFLLWAAFPPLDLWPLAWFAPIPWLFLIRRKEFDASRPYKKLWLAGFVFWLVTIQWLRLPHWATYFGWIVLSFYFAFYIPVFIGLSRIAVHRLRFPLWIAAPMVWTGFGTRAGVYSLRHDDGRAGPHAVPIYSTHSNFGPSRGVRRQFCDYACGGKFDGGGEDSGGKPPNEIRRTPV